jgi:glycosyltransferase involved in cell wall biosynthesis
MTLTNQAVPRVLMWMPSASDLPGGHRVQFDLTSDALQRLGVPLRTATDPNPDMRDLDVVHGFGLSADQVQKCRSMGLRVALSTIYWGCDYRIKQPWKTQLRSLPWTAFRGIRLSRAVFRGHGEVIRVCFTEVRPELSMALAFAAADVLLPNARGEGETLGRELGVATPCHVVPNGVSAGLFTPGDGSFEARRRLLYVGRIEPHKNQLELIKAMDGTEIDLTIVGPPHPHHLAYFDECRRRGRGWVDFLGPMPHSELADLYRSARVHVLPSWFETTGLVSLEAAQSGCNIVTTERGYAREYLGDHAWYCEPSDSKSIRDAVLAAWNSPPDTSLRARILDNYTWDHAAKATLQGYFRALQGEGRNSDAPSSRQPAPT